MPERGTARASRRTVLITGAAGGLGRAFALGFAAQGDRVVVADVNLEGARETVALVEAAGGAAIALPVDVTDLASVTRLAADAAGWAPEARPGASAQIRTGQWLRVDGNNGTVTIVDDHGAGQDVAGLAHEHDLALAPAAAAQLDAVLAESSHA